MAKTNKPEAKSKGKAPSKEKVKKENLTLTVTEKANGEVSTEVKPKEYIEINNPEETIIEPVKEEVSEEVDHVEHIDFVAPKELNYEVINLEGGMCKIQYSDGSSEIVTANDYQSRVANGEIAKKGVDIPTTQKFKSKEEADLEEHYASLGQIDYYIKHVKK